MKRFLDSFGRRSSSSDSATEHPDDSPEGILLREMAAFCESTGRNAQGNEFVHLPLIVETAESSPSAAKAAALRIRKYLADTAGTPNHIQYNAIMLMRILADNPGHTFTCNFDAKFVTTVKLLLRQCRDWHVQNSLRQYLAQLEQNRPWDQDLALLLQMWAKEKTSHNRSWAAGPSMLGGNGPPLGPQQQQQQQPYPQTYNSAPQLPANALPGQEELAARVEEARNSAKLLTQFVQTTPLAEMEGNDLIKEFVDRCRAVSRIIQTFIHATNPPPDENTLQTLIDTNDEVSVALSQQQRAMLKARKARGSSAPSSGVNSPSPAASSTAIAPGAVRPVPATSLREQSRTPEQSASPVELASTEMSGGRGVAAPSKDTSRYEYNSADFRVQNPFADDYATHDSDDNRPSEWNDTHESDLVRLQPSTREV